MSIKHGLSVCCILLVFFKAQANITLPKIIGNNMVLQRSKPVTIWGNASPGEKITVSFAKQIKITETATSGRWQVILDPMPASNVGSTMTITGKNSIQLNGILVGEVWLCSGQSNMEYTMRKNSKVLLPDSSKPAAINELQVAHNPSIRIFLVTSKNLRASDSLHLGWSIAQDSALRSFSAAGYFFAKELYDQLKVPIGIISSAISGSAIEPWMSGTPIIDSPILNHLFHFKINKTLPGKFYPTMIQPLAPFAIKGFLWYQGETNCFQNETIEYTYKMQALINGWRECWNDKELPFYYVQIAPFYYSKNKGKYPLTLETLPLFWEAQSLILKLPHTGMAATTDLVSSPDDLHPGFKWEVGRRLALWPLAREYKLAVTPSGPIYKAMNIRKDKIEILFTYTGSGLISKDGKRLTYFLIAGADGKFVPADATIENDKVFVSAPSISKPLNVRFAWDEAARPNLYNKEGLPALPFRTDNPYSSTFKTLP